MQRRNDAIVLSASDLMRFQGCMHASALDLRYLNGERLSPAEDSASAQLIQEKGHKHEQSFLESLMSNPRGTNHLNEHCVSDTKHLGARRTGSFRFLN